MNTKRQKILTSILARIPQDGWTSQAFVVGAKDAAVGVATAEKFFPNGIADIVLAFHLLINAGMEQRLKQKRNFLALRVRDRVTFAVRARLEAIGEYRESMRRLMVWSVMPRHISQSTKLLWQAADAVWVASGDLATDYNYYTKRLLLIAVMKSTLSFWLNDQSKDYAETWAFLDRRIADVMVVGKGLGVIKTIGISDITTLMRKRFAT